MHPVSISLQHFTANPTHNFSSSRSTNVWHSRDFVKLPAVKRNREHRAMNSRPDSASRSETTGGQDYTVGENDGVIIVDHGSRRQESNLMLNDFVTMFRERTGYRIVEPAHMDIPSLAAEASKEHSNVPYIVTAPLGLHELMVDVMNDRIKYCLRHVGGDVDECIVCAGSGKCRLYS